MYNALVPIGSTNLLNCFESKGFEAESVFLFSGERTGDGRLPRTGSFLLRSSLCSVELTPWERSGPGAVEASGGEVGGRSFKMSCNKNSPFVYLLNGVINAP